jgi:hypothetical protein
MHAPFVLLTAENQAYAFSSYAILDRRKYTEVRNNLNKIFKHAPNFPLQE